MLRGCLSFLLLAIAAPAMAQRPPAQIPATADEVIERLPRGYAALRPATTPTDPSDNPAVEAEQLLQAAGRTGDARLAARADALLAAIPEDQVSTRIMKSRAFSAQHRHEFAQSLQLLNSVIKADPRDADARLARAQLHLVQGQIRAARGDCAALAIGIDSDYSTVCIAALSLRTGDLGQAAMFADRWLAQPKAEPSLRRFMLVMRGEIASRAASADADGWFRQALALGPDDVRTLAAYARHLNHAGRPRDVMALLSRAPDADALQLQLALAAHALHSDNAPALADAQARRYALARAVGVEPELRDEAELLLTLRGNAAQALALALRNFEQQRDYEDVDLLQRAAQAARRPDALAGLRKWADEQGLSLDAAEAAR